MNKNVSWEIVCGLAMALLVAGCSSEEKKYCERMLDKLKVDGDQRGEMMDECVAETKQSIERCKNSDEIRKCYGNVTDGDVTPCVRDCEMTEDAIKSANKSMRCGDIADRCRKVCKADYDCKMACTEAQTQCEKSGD